MKCLENPCSVASPWKHHAFKILISFPRGEIVVPTMPFRYLFTMLRNTWIHPKPSYSLLGLLKHVQHYSATHATPETESHACESIFLPSGFGTFLHLNCGLSSSTPFLLPAQQTVAPLPGLCEFTSTVFSIHNCQVTTGQLTSLSTPIRTFYSNTLMIRAYSV